MKTPKHQVIFFCAALIALTYLSSCTKECPPDDGGQGHKNDSVTIAATPTNWDCFFLNSGKYITPATGKFEFTNEGVKGFGETSRYSCFLITTECLDINNRTVYMKWKGFDGGLFVNYVIALVYNGGVTSYKDFNSCSSPTSYNGSVVISNNTWYYTTIKVVNNQYSVTSAKNDYQEKGGAVIETRNGTITNTKGNISIRNGDPYAGSASYVVVGELKIK